MPEYLNRADRVKAVERTFPKEISGFPMPPHPSTKPGAGEHGANGLQWGYNAQGNAPV